MDLHPAKGVYPATQLVESGLLAALSPTAIKAHIALWEFAQRFDECRPTVETLGARCGLSKNTMTRVLEELRKVGLVRKWTRGRKLIFDLKWENLPDVSPPGSRRKGGKSPYRARSEDDDPRVFFLTADGHRVRSRGEVIVDDRLHIYGVPHWPEVAYAEVLPAEVLPEGCRWTCDFVLHPGLFIEVLGTGDAAYRRSVKRKVDVLAAHKVKVLLIEERDLGYLGNIINAELRERVVSFWSRLQADRLDEWARDLGQVQQDACSAWLRDLARKRREQECEAKRTAAEEDAREEEEDYRRNWRAYDEPQVAASSLPDLNADLDDGVDELLAEALDGWRR